MAPEKCLLLKHRVLSLGFQNPHKSWAWWSLTLVLGTGSQEGKGCGDRHAAGALWPASLALRFSESKT